MRARLVVVLALTALAGCTSEGLGKAGYVMTSTSQGIRGSGVQPYVYQPPAQIICTPNGGGMFCSSQ